MTCGKSTINLEAALTARKVLLFDLSKASIGAVEGAAFGKLIIAMIKGIAFRRDAPGGPPKVPTHLFVDEVHNYVTDSISEIMTEARKTFLHITMAQQTIGAKMPPSLRADITGNANVLITGKT